MLLNRSFNDAAIYQCPLFEYGIQNRPKRMYYVRFYDMVMLDIDQTISPEMKKECMQLYPRNSTWAVHTTTNGFHLYLVSHIFPYHSDAAIAYLHRWNMCDEWYQANATFHGFKVRVSKKFTGENLTHPVQFWGDTDNISPIQMQKVQILSVLRHHHQHCDDPFPFVCPKTFFFTTFFDNILKTDPRQDEAVTTQLNAIKNHPQKPAGLSVHRFILQRTVDVDPGLVQIAQILSMRRPQWLILDTDRYYVAQDMFTCTVYACFRDLLMIDIDEKVDLNNVYLPSGSIWAVHATRKGYHLFAVHQTFDHTSTDTHLLMTAMGCDQGYIEYVKLRGWSVRLNRKQEESYPIYRDISFIGNGEKNQSLVQLCSKIIGWSTQNESAISTMP